MPGLIRPSNQRQLPLSWGHLTYWDSGLHEASTVLFLHGSGCDSTDFDPIAEQLQEKAGGPVRCLALDFRGHGRSSTPTAAFSLSDLADDVTALLKFLNLDRVILAGHSLGGMVAQEVAAKSSRIAGLVLLEGWTKLSTGQVFDQEPHRSGTLDSAITDDIQLQSRAVIARITPALHREFWRSVEAFDASAFLDRSAIPIIAAYGEAGRLPSTREGLLVPKRDNIEFRWIKSAGHYLPRECPEEIMALCLEAISACFRTDSSATARRGR